MKTQAVETNTYYVKSGLFGNPWKSGWLTLDDAIKAADKFVHDWADIGVKTSAIVFYRDGTHVQTVTV